MFKGGVVSTRGFHPCTHHIIIATSGYGTAPELLGKNGHFCLQLNGPEATGDVLKLQGIKLQNLEEIQIHPLY